jgi:hypothetical protein
VTVAPFVYTDWTAQFPQFSTVSQQAATSYFTQATLYLDNSDCSPVPADPVTFQPRSMILYLITAHLAALFSGVNGQPASGLVGRISDASEGSVSVGTALDGLPGTAAWFTQTSWGLAAYQALAPFRLARYRASPGRFAQGRGGYPGTYPCYGYGGGRW